MVNAEKPDSLSAFGFNNQRFHVSFEEKFDTHQRVFGTVRSDSGEIVYSGRYTLLERPNVSARFDPLTKILGADGSIVISTDGRIFFPTDPVLVNGSSIKIVENEPSRPDFIAQDFKWVAGPFSQFFYLKLIPCECKSNRIFTALYYTDVWYADIGVDGSVRFHEKLDSTLHKKNYVYLGNEPVPPVTKVLESIVSVRHSQQFVLGSGAVLEPLQLASTWCSRAPADDSFFFLSAARDWCSNLFRK